jgi:choline dehydrogenase-like flavoprotein
MDPEDFAPTERRCGWPIAYDDVARYYPDALEFLQAGSADFHARTALAAIAAPACNDCFGLDIDRIERFSEPTDVWKRWGAALAQGSKVTVFQDGTCTSVITTPDGGRVVGLRLRTPSDQCRVIRASRVVLACGGLETPRLLLASNETRSCGIGNEHDLVGRYYMTHLTGSFGHLCFAEPKAVRAFDYATTPDGIYARRLIRFSPSVRESQAIGNIVFRPTISPINDASHRDAVLSAMFIAKRLIIPEYGRRLIGHGAAVERRDAWADHLVNVARGLPELASFGGKWLRRRILATRKLPSVFLRRSDATYPLEFNAEQSPDPDSRVLLGSETDPYGVPRLIIRWSASDADVESVAVAYEALAAAAARSGLGTLTLGSDPRLELQNAIIAQASHHIGTVRMGNDARSGVIDRDAEVWGTRGLYVCGASVFPTSGYANPTLTAVALAFRLADHLIQQRRHVGSASRSSPDLELVDDRG